MTFEVGTMPQPSPAAQYCWALFNWLRMPTNGELINVQSMACDLEEPLPLIAFDFKQRCDLWGHKEVDCVLLAFGLDSVRVTVGKGEEWAQGQGHHEVACLPYKKHKPHELAAWLCAGTPLHGRWSAPPKFPEDSEPS